MPDGMKPGAGSDPFSDESDTGPATETSDQTADQEPDSSSGRSSEQDSTTTPTARQSTSVETANTSTTDSLPYIFERNRVKDGRSMVQYFLRKETEELETTVQATVEDELGTDVYLTDLREALVQVGAEHIDEVVSELEEWGYRFND
jgi:hypothetical protein